MASAVGFDEHFRRQYPKLVQELDFILGDRDRARDVAQDAFATQFASWHRVSRLDKPGAWVRRVALRMAFRARRRFFRETTLDERAERESPSVDSDRVNDVRNALMHLTNNQRVATVLHYYRDLPVVEIAASMGCKESTVKVHLHNARQELAQSLADYRP